MSDDAVGTVRRSASGLTAVRVRSPYSDRDFANWSVTYPDGVQCWRLFSSVANWPVVYTPKVES